MPKILVNVKEDICNNTRLMLREEPYESIGIRSIATKCGIGMGTIYNYYRSKEEIIAEVIVSEWNVILRRMDVAIKGEPDSVKRLENIFVLLQEFIRNFHSVWTSMGLANKADGKSEPVHCQRQNYLGQLKEKILVALMPAVCQGDVCLDTNSVCVKTQGEIMNNFELR